MTKLIALNGPPQCGKDTLATELAKTRGYIHVKLATPLRIMATMMVDGVGADYERLKSVEQELTKENMRATMIWLGESIKKKYGQDYWARRLGLENKSGRSYVISDLGFDAELWYFVKMLGPKNVVVVHIRRNGCDFSKDSRGWVDPNNWVSIRKPRVIEIENNDSSTDMYSQLIDILGEWERSE